MIKLKINIRQVAENRGINNSYQLQRKVKLSPSNATKLFNNNIVQVSIITLSKLCEALDCTPNDLFINADNQTN